MQPKMILHMNEIFEIIYKKFMKDDDIFNQGRGVIIGDTGFGNGDGAGLGSGASTFFNRQCSDTTFVSFGGNRRIIGTLERCLG